VCVQVPCVYIPHSASSVTACNSNALKVNFTIPLTLLTGSFKALTLTKETFPSFPYVYIYPEYTVLKV
jgi:hypothetical protein